MAIIFNAVAVQAEPRLQVPSLKDPNQKSKRYEPIYFAEPDNLCFFPYACLSSVRICLPFADHGKCATGMMKKL
jgi:hypothetical protein